MEGNTSSKGPSSAFESPTFGENASFRLDKPVGSASISPCGRDIVLASRQGLHIIDLDSPWSPPRHLSHHTPWEVADVQWSPFAARDYWVVSTSNQKALVWNLEMKDSRASIEHYLHAHNRAITDINFSAHHPDILATCAVDSYVHCWDLRHPLRAAMTFCDWFAGATQVKWNRQDSHILASSHDKFLRIWDDRKGAYPLRSIEAHATKIYGVDWNRTETNSVATCSLDKTIKFWDYTSQTDTPESIIHAPFPVWRARHTPFGTGLLAMPQRNDHDLHLYDRRSNGPSEELDHMPLVHRFDGHEDQVKEFLWRPRGSVLDSTDSRDFQLISWGTDRMLRLHRLDEEILAKVGYVKGQQQVERIIPFTRRNAAYRSFRGDPSPNTKDASDTIVESRNNMSSHRTAGMSGLSSFGHGRQSLDINGLWGAKESALASMAGKKSPARDDVDAISWMKGVKIGKPRTGIDPSVSSVLSPVLRTSQPWDTFDSLAEEITHLADKFSKRVPYVDIVEINMQDRQIGVSLHGPWGSGKASVFVKCTIEVPFGYPNEEAPWVIIESTAGMSDEMVLKATSEVQLIAQAYQERQHHSLEAILRYLLGEQSYHDTLVMLKAIPDQSVLGIEGHDDLSSSDDDDEANNQYANVEVPGLESSDGMLTVSNAQYNDPLPKACGALWADDGRLVCFFPPKEERPPSFIQSLNLKAGEWTSKTRRSKLEGFGRLQSGSSISKMTASDRDTIESGDSDFDGSSESSCSSYSSVHNRTFQFQRSMPSIPWREGLQASTRALSIDESQRSSGANGLAKPALQTSKNFVSIHDCNEILPAKRNLAVEYELDQSSQCCLHNAAVARKHRELDLADIWELINLILKDEVPLERLGISSRHEPIIVIARRVVSPLHSKDSAIDLSYDFDKNEVEAKTAGRIYWGAHPFGNRWLVDALFDYFERLADIQTLAMLSCVLQPPLNLGAAPIKIHGDSSKSESSEPLQKTSMFHPMTAFERYYAFPELASTSLKSPTAKPAFTLEMQKPTSGSQSAGSSFGASTTDPTAPFSTGLTPPTSMKLNKPQHERSLSQIPMSTSPEQYKHVHRSSSNLATAFAASIVRPFSFSTIDSSSPPTAYPKKRLSPAASYLGTATSSTTAGHSSSKSKANSTARVSKTRAPSSPLDEQQGLIGQNCPSFRTVLKNQDQFHNDGYAADSILDPVREERYSAYRAMYADMLLSWKLPVISREILLYNKPGPLKIMPQTKDHHEVPRALLEFGRDTTDMTPRDTTELHLAFGEYCSKCDAMWSLSASGTKCCHRSRKQAPIICQLCHCIVIGLSSPCLKCGHVLHLSCRVALEQDNDISLDGECVTGCGCYCASQTIIKALEPSTIDENTPLVSATQILTTEQDELDWHDVTDDTEAAGGAAWRDIAYESLARNLGPKFLTPKPSQIFRGGEARKASLGSLPEIRRAGSG